jgi:hypothetical protein
MSSSEGPLQGRGHEAVCGVLPAAAGHRDAAAGEEAGAGGGNSGGPGGKIKEEQEQETEP